MKKLFSILLIAIFAVALVACGGTTTTTTTTAATTTTTTTAAPTTTTTTTTTEPATTATAVTQGFSYTEPDASAFMSLDNPAPNGAVDTSVTPNTYTVAGQTFNVVDTFKTTYTTEPTGDMFNYLTNQWQYNSLQYTQMVEGLIENNKYGDLVGDLATSYAVVDNSDGTETWYFQIRPSVPWVVNSDGTVYQDGGTDQYVTAQDFVAGLKYVLDPINGSATVGIVEGLIAGAADYYNALSTATDTYRATLTDNFSDYVGVKAVSDSVVAYTLIQPTPYFLSNLTYSPFLPVSQAYLDSIGTDFGTSENDILVNGAFRMTDHVANSKIEFTANDLYWDKAHVYVTTVESTFVPGTSTPSTLREWYEAGNIDAFVVNANDETGYTTYVTGTDGTGTIQNPANPKTNGVLQVGDATYIGYFNYVRTTYEYTTAPTKTDAQKAATTLALQNVNFRLGVLYGLNVMTALRYYNHNEPQSWLMRGYTIRDLCSFQGKDYADYVDEVYNSEQGTTGVTLTGITNGSDPVYDGDKSAAYFATAKQELIASGDLTADDFPIQLDVIGSMNLARQPYEQSMYSDLVINSNGVVQVGYNIPATDTQNSDWGSVSSNYDFSLWSGWGPDYADPQTFLHTMVFGGDMVDSMGFDGTAATLPLEHKILDDYTAEYEIGAAITDPAHLGDRYAAFAQAEYDLIYKYAIIIPWLSVSGYRPVVSNTVPLTAGRATYGLTADKYKDIIVTDSAITQTQRAAIQADYDANK